jgi:hypothetical protein
MEKFIKHISGCNAERAEEIRRRRAAREKKEADELLELEKLKEEEAQREAEAEERANQDAWIEEGRQRGMLEAEEK